MNKFAIAIVAALALSACATTQTKTQAMKPETAKELQKLRELVGVGEISNTEYNIRKAKLLAKN